MAVIDIMHGPDGPMDDNPLGGDLGPKVAPDLESAIDAELRQMYWEALYASNAASVRLGSTVVTRELEEPEPEDEDSPPGTDEEPSSVPQRISVDRVRSVGRSFMSLEARTPRKERGPNPPPFLRKI